MILTDQQKEFFMNFKDYLENIVIPTVDEFLKETTSELRRARLACITIAHTKDYVKILYNSLDDGYKNRLDQLSSDYELINDICDATKHSILRSKNRNITKSSDVSYRPHEGCGVFNAPFGFSTFNNEGVYVRLQNSNLIFVAEPLKRVLLFFKMELEYLENTDFMRDK